MSYTQIKMDISKLMEQVEVLQEKLKEEKKCWVPERMDRYFFISDRGLVEDDIWKDRKLDRFRFMIGNCYKNAKIADFTIEKEKCLTELKRFAVANNTEDDPLMYLDAVVSEEGNSMKILKASGSRREPGVYFSTKDIAKAAVEEIGAKRIAKYIFGIE